VQVADGGNAIAKNSDVSHKPRGSGAVDDTSATDHEIVLALLGVTGRGNKEQ
jgi:hypothetical protein